MLSGFTVEVVPYARDNYSYLLVSSGNGPAGGHESGTGAEAGAVVLIDCGDSVPVLSRLKSLGRPLNAVCICHTHADHIAGLPTLLRAVPGAVVYSPVADLFTGNEYSADVNVVTDGTSVFAGSGGSGISLGVIALPAHTKKCVNYFAPGALFTSDTLFSAGCGRLFEGTARELTVAMDRLRLFAPDTLIYFGHEYTRANLEFARFVEPGNKEIEEYIEEVDTALAAGGFTTPTTVGRELCVNPFFRIDTDAVIRFVDPERRFTRAGRMGLLRRAKDRF